MERLDGKEVGYGIWRNNDRLPAVRTGDDGINAIVTHGQFLATIQATKLDHGPLLGRNRCARMVQPVTGVNPNYAVSRQTGQSPSASRISRRRVAASVASSNSGSCLSVSRGFKACLRAS